MSALSKREGTRIHEPPDLFHSFLYCHYEGVCDTCPVARELQHGVVRYYGGLDNLPSSDTIDRALTNLRLILKDIFDRLVEQAATRGLLNSKYSIDSNHIEASQYDDATSWNYDLTAEEHHYGSDCSIVSTGLRCPITTEFTQA